MTECIVFWQRMLTPHMTELARQLTVKGATVHYVAEEILSAERSAMGWKAGELAQVSVHIVKTPRAARDLVDQFPCEAVHITQGVRSNGLVGAAQKQIAARRLRHFPIMEKVDLRGPKGRIKPFVYALRFWQLAGEIEGILAIGDGTPEWIARRAPKRVRAIPFAYFLSERRPHLAVPNPSVFRFLFVGSLIQRKSVNLLIEALAGLVERHFDLVIVGDGPERAQLGRRAEESIPGRIRFAGTLDMEASVDQISRADCLVLPSSHDGFGAVVSEALINGTPVICSSECGAAVMVRASGCGAVFTAGNLDSLRRCLSEMLDRGRIDAEGRETLATWARSLTAEAGARYLIEIIRRDRDVTGPIVPPWERNTTTDAEAAA